MTGSRIKNRRRGPSSLHLPKLAVAALTSAAAVLVLDAGVPKTPLASDPARLESTALPRLPTTERASDTPLERPSASRRTAAADRVQVPEHASGRFTIVPTLAAARPLSATRTTYRVEVEQGLPFEPESVARIVDDTLGDPRSWASVGHELKRVDGPAEVRILLASPRTTDDLCAPLGTGGRLSCRNKDKVVLNAWRWVNGAQTYEKDLRGYRRYLINHEVGHAFGLPHAACSKAGAPAPVMLQQTKSLDGCRPNPWPATAGRR
ncbi:DUF3152 domain-containing protein [Aeromicrobium sp. Marseille-Q0843]|uniref:DUF3152 domain-containing protein n=1 Tax=Aeromicrobium phoceense TaxID=2754045 RepID=A0A838XQ43_9ACTN|nr:DUF3152 domain-containing protein [Aeromicrobium phoceense]